METQVTVIARLQAKEGKENSFKETLLKLIEPSRRDEGCINYNLHQSDHDLSVFMFHENWTSKEALEKHLATPHLQDFINKSEELLAKAMDVTLWQKI